MGQGLLPDFHFDLRDSGLEHPRQVGVSIGIEAHGDIAVEYMVGGVRGFLCGSAVAGNLAEQAVQWHRGIGQC